MPFEPQPEEIAVPMDAAKAYVIVAVNLPAAALFYLLQVTQAVIRIAYADGKGAVGKVHEQLAAVQVVGREGLCPFAALWRVGQHKYRQLVLGLQGLQPAHDAECPGGVAGAAA